MLPYNNVNMVTQEGLTAVGNGDEGTDKSSSGGAAMGDDAQGGGSDRFAVFEYEMGCEGRNVCGSRGFLSFFCQIIWWKDNPV